MISKRNMHTETHIQKHVELYESMPVSIHSYGKIVVLTDSRLRARIVIYDKLSGYQNITTMKRTRISNILYNLNKRKKDNRLANIKYHIDHMRIM